MELVIHVPQGRCARLTRTPTNLIEALYTDGFSTCNIVALIGQDKLALFHIDIHTDMSEIKRQYDWIDGPCEIVVIYNREYQQVVTTGLLKYLYQTFQGLQVQLRPLDESGPSGILLSFNTNNTDPNNPSQLHPNIVGLPARQKPEHLRRHPNEREFLTVQKMEQFFGKMARAFEQTVLAKTMLIFDGKFWEPVPPSELILNLDDELSKNEFSIFNDKMTFLQIMKGIYRFTQAYESIIDFLGDRVQYVKHIAEYLEFYLHNYDPIKPFILNLRSFFDKSDPINIFHFETPTSDADRKVCEALKRELAKEDCDIKQIVAIMVTYEKNAPTTGFKSHLTDEYKTYKRHFDERNQYLSQERENKQIKRRINQLSNSGVAHYQKQEYPQAETLLANALTTCSYCYTKGSPEVATAYYNYGRCLQKLDRFGEAKAAFRNALFLRTKYLTVPQAQIDKVNRAISECDHAIDEISSLVASLSSLNI